jgi:hypothetical protein
MKGAHLQALKRIKKPSICYRLNIIFQEKIIKTFLTDLQHDFSGRHSCFRTLPTKDKWEQDFSPLELKF